MNRIIVFLILFAAFSAAKAEVRLIGHGNATQLHIGEQPYMILGGELGNSSATCDADIESNFAKLARMNLNTVLVPAYWELLEPEEGAFDYSLIDKVIDEAKANKLKVVFLWFGAWKNSMSCYAPEWFKKDTKRFPRVRTAAGRPLEIASAFAPAVLDADNKAFGSLLKHIEEYDNDDTVIMVQIENEIGMLEDARDHSDLANTEYSKGVPSELMRHLSKNKKHLHPSLLKKWQDRGEKKAGTWAEVFGDDIYTDEYFMAWNYARYVEALARTARSINSTRPLYVNAALNSRDRRPGEYPSAGPLAHLKDIWHAAAPSVDFLSPDIYDSGFADWVAQYSLPDNTLFIPEVRRDSSNGAQAYYVLGHHNAIGISPFSIENGSDSPGNNMVKAYAKISECMPLITRYQGTEAIDAVLLTSSEKDKIIEDGDTRITLSHYFTLPWDSRANDGTPWPDTAGILIKLADDEYILVGTGIVAKFEYKAESHGNTQLGEDGFLNSGSDRKESNTANPTHGKRIGLAKVEEVAVAPDGSFGRVRTLNGDETHQGRHVRISVDDHKALHIKTYEYQ